MKYLVVLLGPTGVGKTALSLQLALHYNSAILSADSRQLYKGIEIGSAAPTEKQMGVAEHHFIGTLELEDYYSASEFEKDALQVIDRLHVESDFVIVTGGSMLYIDALCKGIDDIPDVDLEIRKNLYEVFEQEGLDPIRSRLKVLDPEFYQQVDLRNYKRVIHALEICLTTGKPYSLLRTNSVKERPFNIIKIGLMRDRKELYDRINQRVDTMIEEGLMDEAKVLYPKRDLNSLNTVGYKELFKYFSGEWDFDFAINKIKQNTRIYSRKQMTWFKKDKGTNWINLSIMNEEDALQAMLRIIESEMCAL